MTSAVSEPENSIGADNVEVKVEYLEINVEEDNANDFRSNISNEHMRRINAHNMLHNDVVYNLWTSKATACLISQYKKYRSMVGQSTQFRSLRDMFDIISVEMQKNGFFFSPQKCENKWRVLERKYKNLVMREMMKKPGRIKHYGHWEHKKALDEIFNEKRKSVYLQESEYPPVGNSTKYALILPKPTEDATGTNEKSQKNVEEAKRLATIEASDPLAIPVSVATTESVVDSSKSQSTDQSLEKLLKDLKHQLEESEKNKERRHLEKMELRQKELKVQERLLKMKEQKLELQKHKILAIAQSLKLNL